MIELNHISKVFAGAELSRRGTSLETVGPALWMRNIGRALRLTSNAAPSVQALTDVSLRIASGEIVGLVGRNGSGKTTLIKILAGLLRPSTGTGQVAGIGLDRPRAIQRQVSYVSTSGWMGLEWPLTVEENIRFFAALAGLPANQARERTAAALRAVEMWEHRTKYPAQLSNGMRQRTILARALLFTTPVLLLDEPTVGLDPVSAQVMIDLIRQLRERGQTIIVTDHQSNEMEALADRIGILRDGRIVREGTPAELLRDLAHVTVIELHTEEMDLPSAPPPAVVLAVAREERPGALAVHTWRIHARMCANALADVLAWIAQPTGRVVFVAESAPRLRDLLDVPRALAMQDDAIAADEGETRPTSFVADEV
jgi:ABC-2 type transport system ATP-binding protein